MACLQAMHRRMTCQQMIETASESGLRGRIAADGARQNGRKQHPVDGKLDQNGIPVRVQANFSAAFCPRGSTTL